MPLTYNEVVSDGAQVLHDVSFDLGYLTEEHVYVYLGGVTEGDPDTQLGYTYINATQIQLDAPVALNETFTIRRIVPHDELYNEYTNKSQFKKKTLEDSFLQPLMLIQETVDGLIQIDGNGEIVHAANVNMLGNRITNMGDAVDVMDATTLQQVQALISAIFDADIDMRQHKIFNLKDPIAGQDAVNLQTLLSMFMSDLDMNNNKILNLKDATNGSEATNLQQVLDLITAIPDSDVEGVTPITQVRQFTNVSNEYVTSYPTSINAAAFQVQLGGVWQRPTTDYTVNTSGNVVFVNPTEIPDGLNVDILFWQPAAKINDTVHHFVSLKGNTGLDAVSALYGEVGDTVHVTEHMFGSGVGSGDYEIVDIDPLFPLINVQRIDGKWLKLKVVDGVHIVNAGADPTGLISATAAVTEACLYARSLAEDKTLLGLAALSRVPVLFPVGGNIHLGSTVQLVSEAGRLNFECIGGKCNVFGDATLTINGFAFDLMVQASIKNINFSGFDTAWEWDTNNIDATVITYTNCDFIDCNMGVDTRSFAESRSTILTFDNCRTNGVIQLTDCYCDQLIFKGGSYKNGSSTNALVKANSKVLVFGGIWTPVFQGAGARWFDLYNTGALGSRGIETFGVRFGPENGGIPIVFNYIVGDTIATSRVTDAICFYGGMPSSTDPTTLRSPVVLMSDGAGKSYAPNIIKFCGASWRGVNAVRTELGEPVLNLTQGEFMIDIDQASWSRLGNTNTSYDPVVTPELKLYLAPYARLDDSQTVTDTGAVTIDASLGADIYFNPGSASVIDTIINAFNGQSVTIRFANNNGDVEDNTTSGSRLFLNNSADFIATQFSSITLTWFRAGNKWIEDGRSTR